MTSLSIHDFGSLLVYLIAVYGTVCGLGLYLGVKENTGAIFQVFFSSVLEGPWTILC